MLWPSVSAAGFLVATAIVVVLARGETARWERARRDERAAARRSRRRAVRGHTPPPGGPRPSPDAEGQTPAREASRLRNGLRARRLWRVPPSQVHPPVRRPRPPGRRRRPRTPSS